MLQKLLKCFRNLLSLVRRVRNQLRAQTGELCAGVVLFCLVLLLSLYDGGQSESEKVSSLSVPWGWLFLGLILTCIYNSDRVSVLTHSLRTYIHHTPTSIYNAVQGLRIPEYTELLGALSGRWLSPGRCSILWGWKDPQIVGGTFSFDIQLYHWNSTPYPLKQSDALDVNITCEGHTVNPSIEPQKTPLGATKVKVTLAVYKAGVYRVSVKIAGQHIQGSPTIKVFVPGAVDVDKSAVVSQLTIQVATVTTPQQVCVQLRDQYNNTCCYNRTQDAFKLVLHEPDTGYEVVPSVQCDWQEKTERVCLKYSLPYTGVYTASVTYRGQSVQQSGFTVISLTESDMSLVTKHVAKQNSDCYFEARLIGNQELEKSEKLKKVYCYLSPRQMTIKEFYMKIFPRRLHTFRICSGIKFTFLPPGDSHATPCLIIEDGCQSAVTLTSKDRNLMVAIFASQMMRNIGGSETFQDKQKFFYFELRKLHAKRGHTLLPITVSRDRLLETSYRATRDFSVSDWCRNFKITFEGEEGLDWGGVRREWFEVLSIELFNPQGSGLFTQFQEDSQGLVLPHCRRDNHLKLKQYEFAGKIVGKCLYESSLGSGYRQLVKARFARSFLAQMIGLRLHYKYLETDDPELYNSKVRYLLEHSAEGLDLVFAEEVYSGGKVVKVTELLPGGQKVAVTDTNKLQYLDLLANYRLAGSVKEEVASFLKGLWEMVPDNLLSMFDEYELELLLCGLGEYSVTDLRSHHRLCGTSRGFLCAIDWLWTILSGFTQQDLARFVQFITGCSQLPPDGFKDLQPQIQISPSQHYGSLPTAHTCFNELCLPEFASLNDMHRALVTAINEGNQGFGLL